MSVTLPLANTAYCLGTLILALSDAYPLCGREVNIQVDTSVVGTVRVGDGALSTINCGYVLLNGQARLYRSPNHDIPAGMIYLMPSVNNVVCNIEILQ